LVFILFIFVNETYYINFEKGRGKKLTENYLSIESNTPISTKIFQAGHQLVIVHPESKRVSSHKIGENRKYRAGLIAFKLDCIQGGRLLGMSNMIASHKKHCTYPTFFLNFQPYFGETKSQVCIKLTMENVTQAQ
jgi:hypothetical protein